VVREFEGRLKREVPQFQRDTTQAIPPGWTLFSYRPSGRLALYILLHAHSYRDDFTFELGWSEKNTLPPAGGSRPTDKPKDGGLSFRIGHLLQSPCEDLWWRLGRPPALDDFLRNLPDDPEDTKLSRVGAQVQDAMQKLVNHGLPYFEKIGAEHGCVIKFR
jgi:hypothetical protein